MRRAVIADDEDLSRDVIKFLIGRYASPLKVVGEAASGDETLEVIHKVRPDLVFIDIKMPVYNGLEVMEMTKQCYADAIQFIVITAYSYFEYAQTSLRLGAKDILLKPIEPKQFMETMERVRGYNYTDNGTFNEILAYIHHNYKRNISLKECANAYHMNVSHISRMFKKYLGMSFTGYINNLKINEAKKLLKDSNLSIKEVADRVGYNNMNYFYKNFKNNTGMTPNIFKKNGSE